MTSPRSLRFALGVVFLLVGTITALQLLSPSDRLAGSNGATPDAFVISVRGPASVCQGQETLYRGTSRFLMTLATYGGPTPHVRLTVRNSTGETVARGALSAGWKEGVNRIRLSRVQRSDVEGVAVCLRFGSGRLAIAGERTIPQQAATAKGRPTDGRFALQSLRLGKSSILGSMGLAAERYGRGNAAWLGKWTWFAMGVLVLVALVAVAKAVLSRATTGRFPPSARWTVVGVLAMTSVWALLVPPFHVPDEISHVAYVQSLVERGSLPSPTPRTPPFSPQERDLLAGLRFFSVIGSDRARPPWIASEEAALRQTSAQHAFRSTDSADSATNNPPLYYLTVAPIYALTRGVSLLDQLLFMRLVSVLYAGLTAFLVFALLRELLPGSPYLWAAGSLVAGLQPVFAFISSGVNPDAALFAASAALFWALVVLLRRGLSVRRAALLGAVVAAGVLSKPLFLGLLPATIVGLLLAAWRRWRSTRAVRSVLAAVAVALAVAAAPIALYSGVGSATAMHPYFPAGVTAGTAASHADGSGTELGSFAQKKKEVNYIWQYFLPRLPFMNDQFADLPLRDAWFDGLVGRFGWQDYAFAPWVTQLALWVSWIVLALAVLGVLRFRRAILRRWTVGAVMVAGALGVPIVIGIQQYNAVLTGAPPLNQARYLLPLLALYASLAAVAMRAAGSRLSPIVGAGFVGIALTHEFAALLLTISRYYL